MKNILITVVSILVIFSSCSDNNTVDNDVVASISISSEIIRAGKDGIISDISVTSSGEWRLSGMSDWAHPSIIEGQNGDVVTFVIDPNESDEIRETTYKFFVGSDVVPLKILSEPEYKLDLLTDREVTFGTSREEFRVKLNTNIPDLAYSFSNDGAEWITYEGRRDIFGATVLYFTIAENTTYTNRLTNLVISGLDLSVEMDIMQKQIDVLQVNTEMLQYDMTERVIAIDVTSNIYYNMSITGEWITQLTDSEEYVDVKNLELEPLETQTLRFHLDEARQARGGTISLSGAGITKNIAIIQKNPEFEVATIPDEIFRQWCIDQEWVLPLSGPMCVTTEKGLTATDLSFEGGWPYGEMTSLEGIENFPNLKSIDISSHNLAEIDISDLKNVSSLKCHRNYPLSKVDLGDNPIETLTPTFSGTWYLYMYATSFTVVSSQLKTLDYQCSSQYLYYDAVIFVDVSECPSLQTLNTNRSNKLTTIYLTAGQTVLNLYKSEVTQIVYK